MSSAVEPGSGAGSGSDVAVRTLVDSLVAISTDLDLDRVLSRLVRACCEITGAAYGALGVLDESTDRLSAFIAHGLTEQQRLAIGSLPEGGGILGLLIREPETIRLRRLQDHPASVGFPANHPPMTTFLGVPVRIRGSVFGNLYLCDKAEGAEFTEQDERFIEVLAAAAAHVVDNARDYHQSEQRRLWLESLALVGEALQDTPNISRALQQTSISVRRIAGAVAVAVVRANDDNGVEIVATDGPRAALLERPTGELQRLLRAAVGRQGQQSRFNLDGLVAKLIPLREHLGPGAAVAVLAESSLDGPLGDLLTAFVDQVALALDRATAIDQQAERMLLSDRDRIARDLHDLVIQRLFATGLRLQGVGRTTTDPAVLGRIAEATAALDETIRDIRSSIFDLRDSGTRTFRAEVNQILAEYVELLGHRPTVRTSGPLDTVVDEEVASHTLAVLREALSNVAKHAQARATSVEIIAEGGQLTLSVADDGVGIPGARQESGLANQRRRAAALGGSVAFTALPDGGTRMRWQVPLS